MVLVAIEKCKSDVGLRYTCVVPIPLQTATVEVKCKNYPAVRPNKTNTQQQQQPLSRRNTRQIEGVLHHQFLQLSTEPETTTTLSTRCVGPMLLNVHRLTLSSTVSERAKVYKSRSQSHRNNKMVLACKQLH